MGQSLTSAEQDALEYLYGGGDETVEFHSAVWVKTRYRHTCLSLVHDGLPQQPIGSRMVLERAKVEGRVGNCYTCAACIEDVVRELREE